MEILSKVRGPLWRNIRESGLAYAITMFMDFTANEVVLMLHDCGDVIKALSMIRNAIVSGQSNSFLLIFLKSVS